MASLSNLTTDELVKELTSRGILPQCKCRKWQTYIGAYDEDGRTLRCHGCLKSISKCTC